MANKNVSNWIFLGAAVGVGGLAFWLSHMYLNSQAEKARQDLYGSEVKMVPIVVAKADLMAGDIITPNNVAVGKIPASHVSRRAVTPERFGAVKDHVLNRAMSSGEPLMVDDVAGVYAERFSDLLKPGERAVTIEASDISSDAGLLLPGDTVDLFLLLKNSSGQNKAKALLPLMEGVRVLAAGSTALQAPDQKYQALSTKASHYGTITVGLPLDRAEKILVARDLGDLAFVMRNSADISRNVTSFASSANLLGGGYRYFSSSTPAGTQLLPATSLNDEGAASRSTVVDSGAMPNGKIITPTATATDSAGSPAPTASSEKTSNPKGE